MPTVRVHHADGLWLADVARPGALRQLPVPARACANSRFEKQGEVGPAWLVFWEARLRPGERAGVEPAEEPPTPPDHPPLGIRQRRRVVLKKHRWLGRRVD